MDITGISGDYFDTRGYFKRKDDELREKGYVVDNFGRLVLRRKVECRIPLSYVIMFGFSIALAITLIVLFVLIRTDVLLWGKRINCPDGFDVGYCQRMDFLDTYVWFGSRSYTVGGEECSNGVAFRLWAPEASLVEVEVDFDSSQSVMYEMT